jgi:4-hydroxy-4-methyl-2-oxoglutarate aldolase
MLNEQQLAFLRSCDSPTLANAIEGFKIRDRCDGFIGGGIRCLFPDLGPLVGTAVTVTMGNRPGPVAPREGYWRMWEALEQAPKPAVLVVQDVSGAPTRVAYFGEVMSTIATRLGAVGVVTDGGVRDLDEVHGIGLRYFARYAVVSHANYFIDDVGVPVVLDGQIIQPGDILHGDVNGIVVIPPDRLDDLAAAVEDVHARERKMMEFIKGGEFSLANLKQMSGY